MQTIANIYHLLLVLMINPHGIEDTHLILGGGGGGGLFVSKGSVFDCLPLICSQIPYKALYGTVSAKIAPRLKCYKNASRLNRYNVPTDNAIDFLFSTLHSEMV